MTDDRIFMSITEAGGTLEEVFRWLPNRTQKELDDIWDYHDEINSPMDLESIRQLAEIFKDTRIAFEHMSKCIPKSISKATPQTQESIILLIECAVRRVKEMDNLT